MKKIYLFFTVTSFFLNINMLNAQTTIELTPSKYNTIYEETNLSNGAGNYIFAGKNAGNNARRALLSFDLSSLPSDANITDVTLTLNMNQTIAGATNVNLYDTSKIWGQGTSDAGGGEGGGAPSTLNDASWNCSFNNGSGGCNTAWTNPGGDFNSSLIASIVVNNIAIYNWTSTNMITSVQNWVDNPSLNFGWIVIGDESSATTAKRFHAKGVNAPKLSITYESSLSVDDFNSGNNINLYPNPSTNFIQIKGLSEIENYEVYNILGAKVLSGEISDDEIINIQNITSGLYFLKFDAGKTIKFIKQ